MPVRCGSVVVAAGAVRTAAGIAVIPAVIRIVVSARAVIRRGGVVRAVIVVAAGAIHSPAVLLRSRVDVDLDGFHHLLHVRRHYILQDTHFAGQFDHHHHQCHIGRHRRTTRI